MLKGTPSPVGKKALSIILYGMAVFALALFPGGEAAAGWRMDGSRFLASAHGDMACVDCHDTIEDQKIHPDPARVNQDTAGRFDAEMCLACHDEVRDEIMSAAGHGGQTVHDPQQLLNCHECHDPHYQGAPETPTASGPLRFDEASQGCMACHQQVESDAPDRAARNRDYCLVCHAAGINMPDWVPVMDAARYAQSPHAGTDCLTCHPGADGYKHNRQAKADCSQCHQPHAEIVAHEAHTQVSCQACHVEHAIPRRDAQTRQVLWEKPGSNGRISNLHQFARPTEQDCARCHFNGNTIGAAAMILPPKGVLCMPCHPATLSARDTTTRIALALAFIGLLGFMSLCLTAVPAKAANLGIKKSPTGAGRRISGFFSSLNPAAVLKVLWWDVLLQRRLYRTSKKRWAIHALIFWPFVVRFAWGAAALFSTSYLKSWPLAWDLVNKNHPATAFLFDITGACLAMGLLLAYVRGSSADKARTPNLPPQDRLALGLLGGIVVVGFILEALRIAMTGAQGPAAYAFVGYGLSRLFAGMAGLNAIYGYVWYLHAVVTGAFVAYLPFSRMRHIIMAPVVLALNAGGKHGDAD